MAHSREENKERKAHWFGAYSGAHDQPEVQRSLGRHRFVVLEMICGLPLQEAAQRFFVRTTSQEEEERLVELFFGALEE
jgi:hypothetical protein